jgi:transcriptional regulator with XRE-family HTH domain
MRDMEQKTDLCKKIGSRIREIRKEQNLTIKDLAMSTGLSSPFLSRLENGITMPSVYNLQAIAESLKVDIGYLFKKEGRDEYVITRKGTREPSYTEKGPTGKVIYEVEYLAEDFIHPFMEPIIGTILGKDHKDVKPVSHGGQELLYVIEGKMEMTLGENRHVLSKGDTIYFEANIPHAAISLSKKPARSLHVFLIPGSRTGRFIK